jgi:hypothetical protein
MHAFHAALPKINFKIFAKTQISQRDQNFGIMMPSKHKIQSTRSISFLCGIHSTTHFASPYFLHFPAFYLATSLPLSKGRAGTALRTFRAANFPDFPPPRYKCSASHCIPPPVLPQPPPLSLSLSHTQMNLTLQRINQPFIRSEIRKVTVLANARGEDTDESGLKSREWLWKGGNWVFSKYFHCKLRFLPLQEPLRHWQSLQQRE